MIKKIAVVGATENLGRELLSILAEREFPAEEIVALDSEESEGKEISYGFDKRLIIKNLQNYDFKGTDIVFFVDVEGVSEVYGKKATEAGCIVIDESSCFRMNESIPLVIPEVNPKIIDDYKKSNIIASPNSSVIQMLVALKPLHDVAKIKRIVVSTYQSVSGAGKEAMDELYDHTKKVYEGEFVKPVKFDKTICFNVLPKIDGPMEDGNDKEESKIVNETKKILGNDVEVSATCVRVPVFACYSQSVNVEFKKAISAERSRKILSKTKGILVLDRPKENIYAVPRECAALDEVFVSRIRKDNSVKYGLNMWIVSDNIRKGGALNLVQIAEILVKKFLQSITI
ncbi:MAG TPA: aspartate-semialdehyde dehydrogenase [Rickettsiales bacterium]|nr:aspartate-semialdehyde dehydrogenase [Rickettsiales bacterium]